MFRDEILQILLSDCAGPKLASRRITQPLRRSQVAMVWWPFTLFEARGINFAIMV